MTDTRTNKHRDIIATGVLLAAFLRASTQKRGIPRLEDFLFGLVSGAELIARTYEGSANLVDTFMSEQVHLQGILSSRAFQTVRRDIGEHRIGETIGDTGTQRNIVAASVITIVPDSANEFGVDPEEVLQILVIAIMATATIHFSRFSIDAAQEMTLDLLREEKKRQQSNSGARHMTNKPKHAT